MTKWKYKMEALRNNQSFDQYLGEMGMEGWELVNISDTVGGFCRFVWKAPLSLYETGETFMAGVTHE